MNCQYNHILFNFEEKFKCSSLREQRSSCKTSNKRRVNWKETKIRFPEHSAVAKLGNKRRKLPPRTMIEQRVDHKKSHREGNSTKLTTSTLRQLNLTPFSIMGAQFMPPLKPLGHHRNILLRDLRGVFPHYAERCEVLEGRLTYEKCSLEIAHT